MATFSSYIQVVIRGLVNGQQWQISPTYTITEANLIDPSAGNFTFVRSSLVSWFTRWWNGDAPTLEPGISDGFATVMPTNCSIEEVRVFAKSALMELPEQLIITGTINGARGSAGLNLPSFNALSCFARSQQFGRKGASMRLPMLIEDDVDGNNVGEPAAAFFQTNILDPLSTYASFVAIETGLVVNSDAGVLADVIQLRPCAVQRVADPVTGNPTFPYEGFGGISAVECADWTSNEFVGTQNSRKVGRGR